MSERFNRTIVERARYLLFDSELKKRFFAEAVNTANYLRNRSIASGLNGKTPYQMRHDKKPDLSNLRIFGSIAMVYIPKEKRLKFDKKSVKHILVGYSEEVKGYRVYNPETDDVTTSRDVNIHEDFKSKIINMTIAENQKEMPSVMPNSVGDNNSDDTKDVSSMETLEDSDSFRFSVEDS